MDLLKDLEVRVWQPLRVHLRLGPFRCGELDGEVAPISVKGRNPPGADAMHIIIVHLALRGQLEVVSPEMRANHSEDRLPRRYYPILNRRGGWP